MKKKTSKPKLTEAKAEVNVEAVVIKPTRIVEIMKAHKKSFWYAGHLRELFLVRDFKSDDEVYEVITKTYSTNKFKTNSCIIHKIDCRIILELANEAL